jgi:hypothetical protein
MTPMKLKVKKGEVTFLDLTSKNLKKLYSPPEREEQFNKEYYNFDEVTASIHNIKSIKETKSSQTNSLFARRLWESLRLEGWKEKKQQ